MCHIELRNELNVIVKCCIVNGRCMETYNIEGSTTRRVTVDFNSGDELHCHASCSGYAVKVNAFGRIILHPKRNNEVFVVDITGI